MSSLKAKALGTDSSILGFNVGVNCRGTAGQTEMHCDVHLIPRRSGDVEKPEGGIRM
jgi:diadenosine tetraphosphate (Ap4A) HIT family hydrolase